MNNKPLAMSYVPWQRWNSIYEPSKALSRGTMFAELDLPFTGKPVCATMNQGGYKNGQR